MEQSIAAVIYRGTSLHIQQVFFKTTFVPSWKPYEFLSKSKTEEQKLFLVYEYIVKD